MFRHCAYLLCCVAAAWALSGCAGASPFAVPATAGAAAPRVQAASGSALTVPFFQSTFKYGGQQYTYSMVGTNPRNPAARTTVTAVIVPVRLVFSNGSQFDATSLAPSVVQSPLFANAHFFGETTQYGDALMRAEFYKYAWRKNYHVLLSAAPIEPTVTVSVPDADGYAASTNGTTSGFVAYSWFVQTIEPQIVSQLAIPPSDLTIFVTAQTQVLEPGGHCCYLGYHYVFTQSTPSGTATWTTAWASVTRTSVSVLSHEVAEWLNDPFYNNAVPSWVAPQTGACGGALLEVGDPVTNHTFRVNGFRLQDVAFFSWFARQARSIGIKGRYDFVGALRSPAANCP